MFVSIVLKLGYGFNYLENEVHIYSTRNIKIFTSES